MASGYPTGVLFLVLKYAFDTVDDEIMFKKLSADGMARSAVLLFGSYLSR